MPIILYDRRWRCNAVQTPDADDEPAPARRPRRQERSHRRLVAVFARIPPVHETPEDLAALQALLDASYARAGAHLRSIWGPETRLGARELSRELEGIQVLDLATVTPAGEPRVAPVDGFFHRGRFWFGSAADSLRFRNIRSNPAVSAALTRGSETFLVLVHGRAAEIDPRSDAADGFARMPRELYDFDWDAVHPDAPYARIEARTLLAFRRP
jgi:uncharacterized pyridoxamine 5'-phosphate oxidase family protein